MGGSRFSGCDGSAVVGVRDVHRTGRRCRGSADSRRPPSGHGPNRPDSDARARLVAGGLVGGNCVGALAAAQDGAWFSTIDSLVHIDRDSGTAVRLLVPENMARTGARVPIQPSGRRRVRHRVGLPGWPRRRAHHRPLRWHLAPIHTSRRPAAGAARHADGHRCHRRRVDDDQRGAGAARYDGTVLDALWRRRWPAERPGHRRRHDA